MSSLQMSLHSSSSIRFDESSDRPTDISLRDFVMTNTSDSDSDVQPEEENKVQTPPIDPKQLTWMPWMWYYTKLSAKKTYEVCDAAGEKLAWFFGITKPKYYAEIQEFERMDEEEREAWRQAFQDVESTNDVLTAIVTTKAPQSSSNVEKVYSISSNRLFEK